MLGEAGDDGIDEPSTPPPGLLDRCWVHPTELAVVTEGYGRSARPWFSATGTAFVAGTLSALLILVALVAAAVVDGIRPPGAVRDAASGAGFGPVVSAFFGDGRTVGVMAVGTPAEHRTGAGTAVCVDADGTLVTAHGVLQGGSSVDLTGADGVALPARVSSVDPGSGLAVLEAGTTLEPARLGRSDVLGVGDPVLLVAAGRDGTTSDLRARVTALVGARHGSKAEQIVVSVAEGRPAAGSALLDSDGAVVGVVVRVHADGRISAVPIERAVALRG